jgi:hypothetical protein
MKRFSFPLRSGSRSARSAQPLSSRRALTAARHKRTQLSRPARRDAPRYPGSP